MRNWEYDWFLTILEGGLTWAIGVQMRGVRHARAFIIAIGVNYRVRSYICIRPMSFKNLVVREKEGCGLFYLFFVFVPCAPTREQASRVPYLIFLGGSMLLGYL